VGFEDGLGCGRTKSGREERHIHSATPLLKSFHHVSRYDEMRSYSEGLKEEDLLAVQWLGKKDMTHIVNHINGRTEREPIGNIISLLCLYSTYISAFK
jgi:hypothetical protein